MTPKYMSIRDFSEYSGLPKHMVIEATKSQYRNIICFRKGEGKGYKYWIDVEAYMKLKKERKI